MRLDCLASRSFGKVEGGFRPGSAARARRLVTKLGERPGELTSDRLANWLANWLANCQRGSKSAQSIIRKWWRFRARRLISKQCADTCPLWSASLHLDFFAFTRTAAFSLWSSQQAALLTVITVHGPLLFWKASSRKRKSVSFSLLQHLSSLQTV